MWWRWRRHHDWFWSRYRNRKRLRYRYRNRNFSNYFMDSFNYLRRSFKASGEFYTLNWLEYFYWWWGTRLDNLEWRLKNLNRRWRRWLNYFNGTDLLYGLENLDGTGRL